MDFKPTQYKNALVGLAAGDAWGYQVEFLSYKKMPKPVPQPRNVWKVSDDTQMTLALERGVQNFNALAPISITSEQILEEFIAWSESPENNRAPGATCMGSIRNQIFGANWYDPEGALESAGCGAVMRLLPTIALGENEWRGATALQALITHKHPMAVAAALTLGEVAREIARGEWPTMLVRRGCDFVDQMNSGTYPIDEYLHKVLRLVWADIPGELMTGAKDLLQYFRAGENKFFTLDLYENDICKGVKGEGWDAGSATVLALLAASGYFRKQLTVRQAMEWAVTSNGDSDSIGAIAGMLIGLSSDDPAFWPAHGINPVFEEMYHEDICY